MASCTNLLGRMLLDLLSFVGVLIPHVVLQIFLPVRKQGFYCNDEGISYPYKEDTVSVLMLSCIAFVLPLIVFVVGEAVHFILMRRHSNSQSASFQITGTCFIPSVVIVFCRVFGIFLFGLAVTASLTSVIKSTTGRLRPNFLSVCQPNFETLNCTESRECSVYFRYVTEDVCKNDNSLELSDARMSFPSGHSSYTFYVVVFLIFYLQQRMTWTNGRLLRHCLQTMLIFIAAFVAFSRIADYRHHMSDVIAGAAMGSAVAAITFTYVLGFIDQWKTEENSLPYHTLNDGNTSAISSEEEKTQQKKETNTP